MGTVTGGPGAVALAPADRDLALAAVKAQLRVDAAADDALIAALAESALAIAEQFVGQALIARAATVRLPAGTGWQRLPVAPVRAITAVTAGAAGAALPPAAFAVDIDPGGIGWVRAPGAEAPLTVTFEAGLASGWGTLPAGVRHGVVLLAAHLHDDRTGRSAAPAAVTALWRPFRAMPLGQEAHA